MYTHTLLHLLYQLAGAPTADMICLLVAGTAEFSRAVPMWLLHLILPPVLQLLV